MQELQAFAQWLHLALTINGSSLMAKTSAEVINVLSNQLRTFRLIEQVGTDTQLIHSVVADVRDMVSDSATDTERRTILNWISNAKPDQKHHDVRLPRVEGTGTWLLEEPLFKAWRDESFATNDVLWCPGIQGSGKSILASLVIDHLCQKFSKDPIPVSYVYFDYKDQDRHSLEAITASLLQQVASFAPAIPSAVASLYHRFSKQKRFPEQQNLVQALSSTCHEFAAVYIVIDALDECEPRYRSGILELIKLLKGYAKVFITSRPYPEDISKVLKSKPQIPIMAHSEDLERYIDQKIEDSDVCDEVDHNFRGDIIQKIIQSTQGMFLLAVLHVQTILDEPTVGDMEEALDRLPRNLNAAFDETMDRIKRQPESRSRQALQCLMLLSHVRRPLQLSELIDALAVRPGLTSVNIKYRSTRKKVLESCHGLVTVDEESQIIRLVHYSVHGFLLSRPEQEFAQGERLIAELCITYQMMGPFSSGCCRDKKGRIERQQIIRRLDQYPFIAYAARYWGAHVLAANSSQINERALDFLRAGPQRASSYQIWPYTKGRNRWYWNAAEADSYNGLHMAAMFRLHDIAVELLAECPIDAPTHMRTTALMQAASCGSTSLVGLFMDMNADSSRENWYGTALHAAAESNEVGCIHALLDRGVDVNLLDMHDRLALGCATQSGNMEAMHALLERGADVNQSCHCGETPLITAVVCAQEARIVQTLLAHHADPNIPSKDYELLPLHLAAEYHDDRKEVAELLIHCGADVNAQSDGQQAVHIAATANNVDILRLIHERGAAVDAQSQDGTTALCRAAILGNERCVELLLVKGADPDIADNEGFTPLHCAQTIIHDRSRAIVQLLLDAGAKQDNHSENRHGVSENDSKRSPKCRGYNPGLEELENRELWFMKKRRSRRSTLPELDQRDRKRCEEIRCDLRSNEE
ncbi:MAG: hypothetical protein Q9200_006532 [Gallowayella weberi]